MAIKQISGMLQKVFGTRNERLLKRHWLLVEQVNALEDKYQQMPDEELGKMTEIFKDALASGQRPEDILADAFAVIRETSDRHQGFRNALLDEFEFDAGQLDADVKAIYDDLHSQLADGTDVHELKVPVEFNAAIRKLYPESRPPFRFRHFDVQVIGGNVLYEGSIAEMATGEGKTLVSTLAAYLVHLKGKKVHVITVNDYLAKRDAEWMEPVYNALGVSVGAIQSDMDSAGQERRDQYGCDLTYGTNNEFGFDYLRDNMKTSIKQMAQGPLEYTIIDEVDSILIDEARTPLIISGPAFDDVTRYSKADYVCRELMKLQSSRTALKNRIDSAERTIANTQGELSEAKKEKDQAKVDKLQAVIDKTQSQFDSDSEKLETMVEYFEVEHDRKAAHLTHDGIGAAQDLAGIGSFFTGSNMEWPHMLEQGLRAHVVFEREKDYVVQEGKVIIVDEFTGRLMHGRQWSDGLHQAVEAKEGVKVKEESQTLATITLQNFFKLYDQLAGMTGTAITEAEEFMNIYELDVVAIPTNRPCVRDDKDDLIFKTMREKFNAIVDEVFEVSSAGRPVLVGTVSIEKSEAISKALENKYNLDHEVLNAKQHQREAIIVEKAGCQQKRRDGKMIGNVTIATNMAGRGTDIKLGAGVAEMGGLHIVGTERHEARRVDNQLRGRAGRQGDNGSSDFFLSFEDDLLRYFASEWMLKMLSKVWSEEGMPIYHKSLSKGIEKAQKKVEERNFESRKSLLEYDEVMDYQRKIFYKRRRDILEGAALKPIITEMIDSIVAGSCENILASDYAKNCLVEWARNQFGAEIKPKNLEDLNEEEFNESILEIEESIKKQAKKDIANDISLSLGEYLEDYQDKATWNVEGLCKWAMSGFAVNLSASKVRQMEAEEVEEALIAGASEQVDKKDFSQIREILAEDYAVKTFVQWTGGRFDVELDVDELKGLSVEDAKRKLAEKVAEKYKQREIEYPVEFAMNMVFAQREVNIYGYESLAKWANRRYSASLTAEILQEMKPQAIHDKLIELCKSYHNGQLEKDIDENLANLKGSDAIVAWSNERFGSELTKEDLEDGGNVRDLIIVEGKKLLRKELTDLERYVLLQIYDATWKDHLYSMDHLKESIFLRAFAEKDPKIEYKHEGYRMFNEMLDTIEDKVTDTIFKVRLDPGAQARNVWNVSSTSHDEVSQFAMTQRQQAAAQAPQGEQKVKQIKLEQPKVGRNEPCPCGSGKKYKKCCGKNG